MTKTWSFDKIMEPSWTQKMVFDEVKELLVSMLDGFNVCIFAYGQTGSGKTHSMQGYGNDPGIYKRTFAELFRVLGERGSDWKYALLIHICSGGMFFKICSDTFKC